MKLTNANISIEPQYMLVGTYTSLTSEIQNWVAHIEAEFDAPGDADTEFRFSSSGNTPQDALTNLIYDLGRAGVEL